MNDRLFKVKNTAQLSKFFNKSVNSYLNSSCKGSQQQMLSQPDSKILSIFTEVRKLFE